MFDPSVHSLSEAQLRLFTRAIAAYAVLSLVTAAFISRVFGNGSAIWLLVILSPPFITGLRIRKRWDYRRPNELSYRFVLLVVVVLAICIIVSNWFATGIHDRHAEDVAFHEFSRVIQQDAAFRNVRLSMPVTRKEIYGMRGSVRSVDDLNRLRLLADQYGIPGIDEVGVVTH